MSHLSDPNGGRVQYGKYLLYILRHKYYVFIECLIMGRVWRGVTHDLSKFFPDEFFPYARYWWGRSESPDIAGDFVHAFSLHLRRNKHHDFSWGVPEGMGRVKVPEKYLDEMIADWIGWGLANGKRYSSPEDFRIPTNLHPESRFYLVRRIKWRLDIERSDGKGSIRDRLRRHLCRLSGAVSPNP